MAGDFIALVAIGDDPERAKSLVAALSRRGFTVISNVDDVIGFEDFLLDAAAVVVACGHSPDSSRPWLGPESGRFVPVELTHRAWLPDEIQGLDVLDLSDWVEGDPNFQELVRRLTALVDDARRQPSSFNPLDQGSVSVSLADSYTYIPFQEIDELQSLASAVQGVGSVLADDAEHTEQIRSTLDEIGATYRVVLEAIDRYYAAGADPEHLDLAALAKLRGGVLAVQIHNGRGHCKRIGARYFAHGGLQGALRDRASAELLQKANSTFGRLASADLDLFAVLDDVGKALTSQARMIYSLVRAGQPSEAQRLFQRALNVLGPLEDALHEALNAFLEIERSLGYAQNLPAEAVVMEDRSINIHGNVTNSVVAGTIKNSHLVLQNAELPVALKRDMERLLAAVGTMSEELSAEDAEAAASELEQLATEIASEQPRKGVVRKCLRSLEQFGKGVAAVGLPVVDLVAKIAAFF